MGKLGLNSGYIGSDQRTTTNGVVGYDKYYLERGAGRFFPVLEFAGLLDFYPNAAAAYSLRRLSGTYQGSAIRVRRSSDNTEQDIGFDFNGNLNTAALLSFCGVGNGFVTAWYDQSGNARNATQSTGANQPQIVSSGSVILDNNKPAVQFNGTNKNVLFTPGLIYTTNNILGFAVFSTTNNTLVQLLLSQNDFVDFPLGRSTVLQINSNKGVFFFNNGTSYTNNSLGTISNNTQTLMLNYSSDDDYYCSLNGSSGNSEVTNQVFTPSGITAGIGAQPKSLNNPLFGKIQEIVVYNSDQITNKTGLETNINSYYNIY
jgi:hypothetical protein